jgi:hypothetical protein
MCNKYYIHCCYNKKQQLVSVYDICSGAKDGGRLINELKDLLYENIQYLTHITFKSGMRSEIIDLFVEFLLDKRCVVNSIEFRYIDPINKILENVINIKSIHIYTYYINFESYNNSLIKLLPNLDEIYLDSDNGYTNLDPKLFHVLKCEDSS